MKISIVTQGLGVKSGGPSRSVLALAEGLIAEGVEVEILTTDKENNPNIKQAEWIKCAYAKKSGLFGFIRGAKSVLKKSTGQLFHIQGMFSYIPVIAPAIARAKHIPYVIVPRGMMYANALKKSALKKSVFRKLFVDRDLNKANAIHATCIEEMQEIRNAGITAPIAIIPNSITVPEVLPPLAKSDKFRVGFVGRINIIKNIDGLMKAWALAGFGNREDAELLIIGGTNLDSEVAYQNDLFKLEKDLGITNIVWAGMKTGKEKDDLLRTCSVAVLPSHSENFGMVIPEALINGIPCIASDKTPWKMLEENQCGWSTPNDPESMANVLIKASKVSPKEHEEMGKRGQQMVLNNFSTEKVTGKLIELYKWVLGEREIPDFVFIK